MIAFFENEGHMLSFSQIQQWALTGGALGRLLLAAVLGGVIGIDREAHHRPSGIRTNLLICIGAALFTFLSSVIAGDSSPNKGQIASNIVQGIGFLGAGLILHNRDRVSGLISAATVWAVASIGMACGAGLYAPAILSAVLVLVVLEIVGLLETRGNLKSYLMFYEVRGEDVSSMTLAILNVLDGESQRFAGVESMPVGLTERLTFSVSTIRKIHQRLEAALRTQPAIADIKTFRSQEDE